MIEALPLSSDVSLNLATAVVLASNTPSLLLNADLTVIAASRSFCRSFGIDPARAVLVPLASLGGGAWNMPQLSALLLAAASGFAAIENYEMDLQRDGSAVRHLLIHAHKLEHPGETRVLVLLSAADVTETRRREAQHDSLIAEKVVLLRELHHRVANSLQIIASVLMQSAQRVQSDEARSHIHDAHHRLMSVAELQKQLAISDVKDVDLAGYLASLCRSIGASMIYDQSLLTIRTVVDDSLVDADVSLSLGLIVTELVMNALKHAYPDERAGAIVVGYASDDGGWTLTVRDDGVGMPKEPADAKVGLGSSIIRALAMQLDAEIATSSARPGTLVSVTHGAVTVGMAQPALEAV